MIKEIKTNHGTISLPAFMPDATYGSIKTASFEDVKRSGIKEIVSTTLHLEQKIGSQYIKKMGGIHKFFGWDRPILTDSGGWQVFSLINAQGKRAALRTPSPSRVLPLSKVERKLSNAITELGCTFIDPESGKSSLLTPEASIQIQANLGSDIMTVLDDPIIGDASLADRTKSVRITTEWAKRSKKTFEKLFSKTGAAVFSSLLGAVIQGADDFKLRKQSAEELLELDFDLYNFGGIPMMNQTTWKAEYPTGFYTEMLHYVSELIPENKIKYAMGVGQPEDIAFCVSVGWNLFDTVLPTRNARHGYLYVSEGQGNQSREGYDIMNIRSERYKFDENQIDENCDCECCTTVSRAYLRHLIRIKESAGQRLATIHNLRFYSRWMESLKS